MPESYVELVQRLSVQSVKKHFDAYADVAWDAPEMAIDPHDPRWELPADSSLGGSDWYKAQPASIRAEIGLHTVASAMKVGVVFESVLKRGLLEYASTLDNRAPEFRYAYHEVIEEAQHSLMFQEFINRTPFDPPGLSPRTRAGARFVVRLGRVFPELFFLFVLGGEEPIDFVQRRELRSAREMHPLLKRISQIHITEEARHLCFAREFLQQRVPQLPTHKRIRLGIAAPFILAEMARMMLEPSGRLIRRYQIPREVIRAAYHDNPKHEANVRESLASVMELCRELKILNRKNAWLWRVLGLGDPFKAPLVAGS
ncbi:MAG TPA: diiron oxygenase [Polyangiales bacterium]|jgi:hypothetical protein|nr:diiron oxygenase [Polyangiales bacterium]